VPEAENEFPRSAVCTIIHSNSSPKYNLRLTDGHMDTHELHAIYSDLLECSLKNGCLKASEASKRSEGSNLRRPCNKSINSPAEWSACCIIKSLSFGNFLTALMLSLEDAPSGQFNRVPCLKYFTYLLLFTG